WPEWQRRCLAHIVRVEARMKGWLAKWRGDSLKARWMRRLGRLASAMQEQRFDDAQRLIHHCVAEWESQENAHGPGPINCDSEPQSARPAPRLSRQRPAVRSR